MSDVTTTVLASEPALPIDVAGWAVLVVGLLITAGWLFSLYR